MTKKRWIAVLSALGIVIAAALTTAAVMPTTARRTPPRTTRRCCARRPTTTADRAHHDDARDHDDRRPREAAASRCRRRPIPMRRRRSIQIGSIEIPKIGLAAPGVRRHHAHRDRSRPGPLARFGAAVPARQHRVPRAPGHAHASVPEPRPPFAGRPDHLPHAGQRLRLQGHGHADRRRRPLST